MFSTNRYSDKTIIFGDDAETKSLVVTLKFFSGLKDRPHRNHIKIQLRNHSNSPDDRMGRINNMIDTAALYFMPPLTLVVAATAKNGIGRNGTIPWHIPKDLKYFSQVTSTTPTTAQMNAVFMGRKTWESIPHRFKPLRRRINVVLSRNENYELFPDDTVKPTDPTHLCSDLKTAVETFGLQNSVHRLFIIGGASVYQEALQCPSLQADRILITRIYDPEFECDVFFPDVLGSTEWSQASHQDHSAWVGFNVPSGVQTENGIKFEFQMWVRSSESFGAHGKDS